MPHVSPLPIGSDDDIDAYRPGRDELSSSRADRLRRAAEARHSSGRRRRIDPTTCERDYSAAELEFFQAVEDYKRRSGRMFPTWNEVLEVVRGLGYRKHD